MIEFIKHALGLCGDGHPSLLLLLGGLTPVVIFSRSIKYWVSNKLTFLYDKKK